MTLILCVEVRNPVLPVDTLFERKRATVGTVTLMLEPDGVWRVTAYL